MGMGDVKRVRGTLRAVMVRAVIVSVGVISAALVTAGFASNAGAEATVAGGAIANPDTEKALSTVKVFRYTDRTGTPTFSDRAPPNTAYRVIHYRVGCYACNPRSRVDWHSTPLYLQDYQDTITLAANRYGVDPALVRAVIHAESAFRPNARSKKGALGLMQLMPDTARDMGVNDALSASENIQGGVRYLAWLLEKTNGNTTLATAAYNAGPGAVERYRGIPPYEETQTYVKRVRILHGRYRDALAKS